MGAPALFANAKSTNRMNNNSGKVVLFQGDSITDAGRDKKNNAPNNSRALGSGYPFMIASQLLGMHPEDDWKFYNRGISGNKVFQLADRWDEDCLELEPDVLCILIGVNDFWHSLRDYDGTPEVYEKDFRALMERTKETLGDTRIIICEPFAVAGGTALSDHWNKGFPPYRTAAKKIAKEFGATFISFQSMFDKALKSAPVSYWCPDGVHPSPAGHYIMGQALIKEILK